ncbi:hypothetical protein BS17DRAFT_763692 [Gyrodon lividus]|nr:hypothetical protein BS17DRAFT_763692 [Gyrodon lividus]
MTSFQSPLQELHKEEHGLAKTATAMFGDHQFIPFHYIGAAALILMRWFKEHLVPLEVRNTVDMFWHLYMMFSSEVKFRNFTHLIDNARPFQATDPRDKVHALLEHRRARFLSGGAVVEPDYRKSTLDVYREASVKMIQHGQSIDILSDVQHDPATVAIDPVFPSCVSRFDKYYSSRVLGRYTSNHLASDNNPLLPSPYPKTANRTSSQFAVFSSIPSVLTHTLIRPH